VIEYLLSGILGMCVGLFLGLFLTPLPASRTKRELPEKIVICMLTILLTAVGILSKKVLSNW
jgi:uncharacterized protein YacL